MDVAQPMHAGREHPSTHLKIVGIPPFAVRVDDLDRELAELEAAGVHIACPPRDVPGGHGGRFAGIHDNERTRIALFPSTG